MDEGEGIEVLPKDPNIHNKIEGLEAARGIGIFLIKQLVDQVEFKRTKDDGHEVRMVIKLER